MTPIPLDLSFSLQFDSHCWSKELTFGSAKYVFKDVTSEWNVIQQPVHVVSIKKHTQEKPFRDFKSTCL